VVGSSKPVCQPLPQSAVSSAGPVVSHSRLLLPFGHGRHVKAIICDFHTRGLL
jgi:hypothetical protein